MYKYYATYSNYYNLLAFVFHFYYAYTLINNVINCDKRSKFNTGR